MVPPPANPGAVPSTRSVKSATPTRAQWSQYSVDEADKAVADAVCQWPSAISFNPVIDGIDYSILVRQRLWSIVSGYVRGLRNTCRADASMQEDEAELRNSSALLCRPRSSRYQHLRDLGRRTFSLLRWLPMDASRRIRGRPVILVPFAHPRWKHTRAAIERTGLAMASEMPVWHSIRRNQLQIQAGEFADWFVDRITDGLRQWSVELSPEQSQKLRHSVAASRACLALAERTLERMNPALLFVNTAATSPGIEYVLAARRRSLPVVAVQYGLDCDHHAYDDAFADHLAVWSESRRSEYLKNSAMKPATIEVTGNPEYDRCRLPERSSTSGSYWLWVTRPHPASCCKLVSQEPTEGLAILGALLDALQMQPRQRLVIKPHPKDYGELYVRLIRARGLSDRVMVTARPLRRLVPQASVVITEDTTAGLDALFYAKPMIHARFAATAAVLPFADYEAALPASDPDQLIEAIRCLAGNQNRASQLEGQRRFLRDFAGHIDGRSSERLTEFLAGTSAVR
ncbi:MAG: hypothetical protein RIK87_28315 [Fuerstiella sp.]